MTDTVDASASVYWCVECGPLLALLCEDGDQVIVHKRAHIGTEIDDKANPQ